MSDKPSVLFVCVHNAGRSQMAAGWLRHLAANTIDIRSAGSEPAEQINPTAVQAMREVGIDITGNTPQLLDVVAEEKARSTANVRAQLAPGAGVGGAAAGDPVWGAHVADCDFDARMDAELSACPRADKL